MAVGQRPSVQLEGPTNVAHPYYRIQTIRGAVTLELLGSKEVLRRGDAVSEETATALSRRYEVTIVAPKR